MPAFSVVCCNNANRSGTVCTIRLCLLYGESEKIGGICRDIPVAVDNGLYLRLDTYRQGMAGFSPDVADIAVVDVFAAEVSDIDKGHAAGAVAEQEKVAGQTQAGCIAQLQFLQADNHVFVYRTLGGLVDAGIDVTEGKGLDYAFLADGTVVNRTQVAHIERGGIGGDATLGQPVGILSYHDLVEHREGYISAVQKFRETGKGASQVAGAAQLAVACHAGYQKSAVRRMDTAFRED